MNIIEERKDAFLHIKLEGRLDANSAPILEEKILAIIDSNEKNIVYDLAKLDYISSAGLRTMLITQKRLTAVQGKLYLTNMNPFITEIFDTAGFFSIFKIAKTEADIL